MRESVSTLAYDALQPHSLSEQTGEVESYVKSIWSEFFAGRPEVIAAFLARARLREDGSRRVALLLRVIALDHERLLANISAAFEGVFHPDQTLSVVFLTAHQEAQVRSVARPFYAAFAQEEAIDRKPRALSSPHAPNSRALRTVSLDSAAALFHGDGFDSADGAGDDDSLRRTG